MDDGNDTSRALSITDSIFGAWFETLHRTGLYLPAAEASYTGLRAVIRGLMRSRNHLEVLGEENIPREGGVVLAANHQSWLDVFALAAATDRRLRFIAKAQFDGWPVIRHGVRFGRAVFVRRGGDDQKLAQVVGALKEGAAIAIFPEGTIPGEEEIPRRERMPQTGLLRGKTGAVRLAMRAGVPIVPVGISGTERVLPSEVFPRLEVLRAPGSTPISVRFGKPFFLDEYRYEDVDKVTLRSLTEQLMFQISDLVDHSSNSPPTYVPAVSRPQVEKLGVLVLHGFSSNLDSIAAITPALESAGYTYAAPVLRGHGTRYQDLVGVEARDWYADAEHALIRLWDKVDKVAIVGLSMGGLVGLELAARHPGKVAGLVTVGACLKFKNPRARFAGKLAAAVKFWPSPRTDGRDGPRGDRYEKFPLQTFASLYEYSLKSAKRLSNVHVPIRVLQSKADSVAAPVSANIIYEKVASPIRELFWYEKTDHSMVLGVESERVMADIMSFLNSFKKEGLDCGADARGDE